MAGYSKLFSSILNSSIWGEDNATRLVWITMLALSDSKGHVDGSIPGLAHQARVSIQEVERALSILTGPDPYSRTTAHEGRRLSVALGGWVILNYEEYRNRGQSKEGSRAPYMKGRREKCNALHQAVTDCNEVQRVMSPASASAFPGGEIITVTRGFEIPEVEA